MEFLKENLYEGCPRRWWKSCRDEIPQVDKDYYFETCKNEKTYKEVKEARLIRERIQEEKEKAEKKENTIAITTVKPTTTSSTIAETTTQGPIPVKMASNSGHNIRLSFCWPFLFEILLLLSE
eukprot:GHVR01131778.1.p1 GENE.GHVR01131778.1~~GHVR01131778.1.p1  ORF type:complete len:123 (+),score=19.86 GHVR01131778.1:432-800(+)